MRDPDAHLEAWLVSNPDISDDFNKKEIYTVEQAETPLIFALFADSPDSISPFFFGN